jgi:methionine-rich copper-binding protein CopC
VTSLTGRAGRRARPALFAAFGAAVAAGLLTGLFTSLVAAGPAYAHASLVRIEPADGAAVATAPSRVRLVFDENVRTPSAVVVTAPNGDAAADGPARILDNTVTVAVTVTRPGRYAVAYRVVSADGHPVSGSTSFRYAPGGSVAAGARQHAGHDAAHHSSGGGLTGGRTIAVVAVVALLAGLALLTIRRRPGSAVDPGGGDSR